MASLIGALRVSLSADTAAFASGMKRAEGQAKASAASIKVSLSGISKVVGAVGIGLAAGAVAGLIAASKHALDYASSLSELAQQMGVTVEQYQILDRAALANGASTETMQKAVEKLGKTLGDAQRGSKEAINAFAAVGISREQLDSFRQAGDAIKPVMEGIKKLGDGSLQASASTRLMGRSAQELLPFLTQGAAGYDAVADAAVRAGLLTQEQADKADAAKDSIDLLAKSLETKLAIALTNNLPAISAVIDALSDLIDEAGRAIGALRNIPYEMAKVRAAAQDMLDKLKYGAGAMSGTEYEVRHAANQAAFNNADSSKRAQAFRDRLNASYSIAPPRPAQAPRGATSSLAGGGGKHHTAKAPRDKTDQDLIRAKEDELRAQQSLATDYVDRDNIAIQLIDLDREQKDHQADLAVSTGTLSAKAGAQIKLMNARTALLQKQEVIQQENLTREREKADLEDVDFSLRQDQLQAQRALAETAAERREIELRILDLSHEQERADIARLKASTDPMKQLEGQHREDALNRRAGAERAGVLAGTRGPFESFLASLPTTAAKADEALQEVAANGLQSLTDGLTDAITGAKSLGEVFSAVAKRIVADLIKIAIERAVIGPLANVIGGAFGGGGNSALASLGSGTGSLPGFASGGSFRIGGISGVDRNLLSVNGLPIARVGMGERIHVDPAGKERAGGQIELTIRPTSEFDVRISQQTGEMGARVLAMVKPLALGAVNEQRRRS